MSAREKVGQGARELMAHFFQLGHILDPILGGSQFAIGNHEHSSDLFTGLTGPESIRQPTAPTSLPDRRTASPLSYKPLLPPGSLVQYRPGVDWFRPVGHASSH